MTAEDDHTQTQSALILAHMEEIGPITPLEALNLYECFRLGARIFDLKKQGHAINAERVEVGTQGKRVAKYSLA